MNDNLSVAAPEPAMPLDDEFIQSLDEDTDPYLLVTFKIDSEFSTLEMTERAISAYMEGRGFEDIGSGTGFGRRDLEFGWTERDVPTQTEINTFAADLSRQTGRAITVELME